MDITLTTDEVHAVLGAYLMYGYVPFSRAPKQELTELEIQIADSFRERLLEMRDKARKEVGTAAITLSGTAQEAGLYARFLTTVLAECAGDDYTLELHVASRSVVEDCLAKFKRLISGVTVTAGDA